MKVALKKFVTSPVLATAFALFAMLFGSGNIALPLGLGRDMGSMAVYAMIGFFMTAVFVPMLGIVGMSLYDGDYQAFVQRIGKIPGYFVVFICIALMGPFFIIPRCIAVSHAALGWVFPSLSRFYFSFFMGMVIFLATIRKNTVVNLMSRFLGPLKLLLLSAVIVKGFFVVSNMSPCSVAGWDTFAKGLLEGYGTLDLIGVMFFSGLLIVNLRKDALGNPRSEKQVMSLLIKAGFIGALLLGIMYAGFVLVAAKQSILLQQCFDRGQLLSVLASIILGAGGGVLASVTIAVACLTTAIALTTVFADLLKRQVFRDTVSYVVALIVTLSIAIFFANYGFEGIQKTLMPVVTVLYPALIVLFCTNIAYKMWNIDFGKAPFYVTLAGALIAQLHLLVWL